MFFKTGVKPGGILQSKISHFISRLYYPELTKIKELQKTIASILKEIFMNVLKISVLKMIY